ncbi:MAG: cytidylate kinase-like family protein [Clostridia bacterium]|nr:cytidylate kinase-like family protein [Clostridia bacterium]
MKDNLVITISREFGSAGREIGEKAAKALGIPFYDRAIILKAAENSGLSEDFIEKEEQRVTNSMLFNLSTGGIANQNFQFMSDQIYIAQSRAIREYADEGSCVIVGRCADYILREDVKCLNVFIYADKYFKLNRIMQKYALDQSAAEKMIKESDKKRSRHYRFYTSMEWGEKENYALCINSGKLGVENAVQIIIDAAEKL